MPARERIERDISFVDYINLVHPKYRWYNHCVKLAAVLQRVADGEIKRLMVFEPPRHGKSEEISRLFSSYFLYRYPWRWVSINSYGASLADGLSGSAREYYKHAGGECSPDTAAKKEWKTLDGGGMFAAGVGGPITGKGWHLGIIDDPLKNAEESLSETIREKQKDWYTSTFYTREEPWSETDPDGALIIVLTRWNEDDLAGWQLSQERSEDEDDHEHWHVVSLEAIKLPDPLELPETCTLEPDERQVGEALCPERRPLEKLNRIRKKIGEYFWNSLFNQRPYPAEGDLIKLAWFRRYRDLPQEPPQMIVVSWDTANKKGKLKAYTVGGLFYIYPHGSYLVDVWRDKVEMPVLINTIQQFGIEPRETTTMPNAILIEDKASGTGAIQIINTAAWLPIIPIEPESDKLTRVIVESPAIQAGGVYLPENDKHHPWLAAFIKEVISVPNSPFMDQVDMLTQFLHWKRKLFVSIEHHSSGKKRVADTVDDYLECG